MNLKTKTQTNGLNLLAVFRMIVLYIFLVLEKEKDANKRKQNSKLNQILKSRIFKCFWIV